MGKARFRVRRGKGEEKVVQNREGGVGCDAMRFTLRNSLSSRGGFRGGCGGVDGEDLVRRMPNLPRRLLLRGVLAAVCAWERTKAMDESVGSGGRISMDL